MGNKENLWSFEFWSSCVASFTIKFSNILPLLRLKKDPTIYPFPFSAYLANSYPLSLCSYHRQHKRKLSESRRQFSLERKPSLTRRVSAGSESHVVPRPPLTPHDRHVHTVVANRTLTSKHSDASVLSRGQFSPSSPSSANQIRMTPSPPSSAKTSRPNSASRFRKMVVECRDSAR